MASVETALVALPTVATPSSTSSGGRVRLKRAGSPSSAAGPDDGTSWTSHGGGSEEADSLRPVVPPRRKRRRRHLLDAMASINLRPKDSEDDNHNNGDDEDDAGSSQAVADDDEEADAYSINSSLDDDEVVDDDDDENDYPRSLSGEQQAQRKVMFELVFGPEKPKSAVDLRLEELIRRSIREAAPTATHAQDDMSIDACSYCRPSVPLRHAPLRTRSNSLPHVGAERDAPSCEDMEVDDVDD